MKKQASVLEYTPLIINVKSKEGQPVNIEKLTKKLIETAMEFGAEDAYSSYLYDEVIDRELLYITDPELDTSYDYFTEKELAKLRKTIALLSQHWELAFITDGIRDLVEYEVEPEVFTKTLGIPFNKKRLYAINHDFIYILNDEDLAIIKEQDLPFTPYKQSLDTGVYYLDHVAKLLYKQYYLDYDFELGYAVSFNEFINNELKSEDYLETIDGSII